MAVGADEWRRLPFAAMRPIPYRASFDAAQSARLREGLRPRVMEDKWFVYFDDPALCLHRSWTGAGVYRVVLRPEDDGCAVAEATCAAEVLATSDAAYQAALLDFLIANLLLGEARPFPGRADAGDGPASLDQHAVAGTGYPERAVPRRL